MSGGLRVPALPDLDARLMGAQARAGDLWRIADEHTASSGGRCPACGWQTGRVQQRDCPSRAIARALMRGEAVPMWLAHFAGDVPGVRAPARKPDRTQQRAALDDLPGLFDPPPRTA